MFFKEVQFLVAKTLQKLGSSNLEGGERCRGTAPLTPTAPVGCSTPEFCRATSCSGTRKPNAAAAATCWEERLGGCRAGQSWNTTRFGHCRGIFAENFGRWRVRTVVWLPGSVTNSLRLFVRPQWGFAIQLVPSPPASCPLPASAILLQVLKRTSLRPSLTPTGGRGGHRPVPTRLGWSRQTTALPCQCHQRLEPGWLQWQLYHRPAVPSLANLVPSLCCFSLHLLSGRFGPQAIQERDWLSLQFGEYPAQTNVMGVVTVTFTEHSISKSSCSTPFLTDPGKTRTADSAAGYSRSLYSLRQLL